MFHSIALPMRLECRFQGPTPASLTWGGDLKHWLLHFHMLHEDLDTRRARRPAPWESRPAVSQRLDARKAHGAPNLHPGSHCAEPPDSPFCPSGHWQPGPLGRPRPHAPRSQRSRWKSCRAQAPGGGGGTEAGWEQGRALSSPSEKTVGLLPTVTLQERPLWAVMLGTRRRTITAAGKRTERRVSTSVWERPSLVISLPRSSPRAHLMTSILQMRKLRREGNGVSWGEKGNHQNKSTEQENMSE